MTLGEMKQYLRQDLVEDFGSPLSGDPITIERDILDAADEIAERTFCLHTSETADVTADLRSYCKPPTLFRLTSVEFLQSSGDWLLLPIYKQWEKPSRIQSLRNDTAGSDPPQIAVINDAEDIELLPTPSTTRTGALRVSGFYKPGDVWSYDVNLQPEALADSQECPLPQFTHRAVLDNARVRRLRRLIMRKPEMASMLSMWERVAAKSYLQAESNSRHFARAAKNLPNQIY